MIKKVSMNIKETKYKAMYWLLSLIGAFPGPTESTP